MSTKSAGLAKKIGYKNIQVMLKGVPGWKKAGNAVVASDDFVEKGNIVLVDLRPAAQVKKGHIPRAVGIPMADIEDAEDDFPTRNTAPIVLYGNGKDAKKAGKIIKGWGYKKISMVNGGIEGFTARGGKLAKGAAATEINWVRKLGKGEISETDFKLAMTGKKNQVILDVRTNDEVSEGKFKNAIHVPLDEIEARMSEIPKDKEILVHCTTGARAEMGFQALKKAGYKTRFLVADVECEDGECEIVE